MKLRNTNLAAIYSDLLYLKIKKNWQASAHTYRDLQTNTQNRRTPNNTRIRLTVNNKSTREQLLTVQVT